MRASALSGWKTRWVSAHIPTIMPDQRREQTTSPPWMLLGTEGYFVLSSGMGTGWQAASTVWLQPAPQQPWVGGLRF